MGERIGFVPGSRRSVSTAGAPGTVARRVPTGLRALGLVAMVMGLVATVLAAGPVSAQEEPPDGLLPPGDWSQEQVDVMLEMIDGAEEMLPAFSDNGYLDEEQLTQLGFHNFGITAPGGWSHWINSEWLNDDRTLDPEHPESLVFRNTGGGLWELEAAMYFLTPEDTMDTIPEEIAWLPGWHAHPELCWDRDHRFTGFSGCTAGSEPITIPMMHVWITDPGCGHRFGGVGVGGLNCNVHGYPAGPEAGYPFGADVYSEMNGYVAVRGLTTGWGRGGSVPFPIGGEGVCKPTDEVAAMTGSVSESQLGHADITGIQAGAVNADLLVTQDGAICTRVVLDVSEGELQVEDGTGTVTLHDVTADMEIFGTGVFEPIVGEGCSLAVDIGELSGPIGGDGPPNEVSLSALGISVAEAPDTCGVYGLLLNVGFGLPTTSAEIALDLSLQWDPGHHDH